jgi:protein TonB
MIRKLLVVAVAATLSLPVFAANAAEVTTSPKTVHCSAPSYPRDWVTGEVQGTVRLAVLVGADGSVKDTKVLESSGLRELDKASQRASSTCKFGTASKDGDSMAGWTTVQYKWVTD